MELNEQALIPLNGGAAIYTVRAGGAKRGRLCCCCIWHGGARGRRAAPGVKVQPGAGKSILPWWYGSSGGVENPITGFLVTEKPAGYLAGPPSL